MMLLINKMIFLSLNGLRWRAFSFLFLFLLCVCVCSVFFFNHFPPVFTIFPLFFHIFFLLKIKIKLKKMDEEDDVDGLVDPRDSMPKN